jgi:hypothetical protein
MQQLPAAPAIVVFDVDHHFVARQMRRKRSAVDPTLNRAIGPFSRIGVLGFCLAACTGLFDLFKPEQHLIFRQRAPIASEALQRITALYQIEAEIRGNSADERRTVRQEKSRPILNDFEPWLRVKLALISQKATLAEAIRYVLSRWDGLCRFVDDRRIEIDSNVVERAIRPIALNRKNALFAGLRCWRRTLGRARFADRDPQTQQCRSPRLSRVDHHEDRQRPSQRSPR